VIPAAAPSIPRNSRLVSIAVPSFGMTLQPG